MLAIFYCIKISQTTKKKKNNLKKMYEIFPNKEVLKYNHKVLMPVTGHASYDFKKKYNHVTFNLNFIVYIEWTQGV